MRVLFQYIDRYGSSPVDVKVLTVEGTSLKSVLPKLLLTMTYFNENLKMVEAELKAIQKKKNKRAADLQEMIDLGDELKDEQKALQLFVEECNFNKAGTVAHNSGEESDYIFVNLDKVKNSPSKAAYN